MIRVVQRFEQTTGLFRSPKSIPALFVPRSDDVPVRGELRIDAPGDAEFGFESGQSQKSDEIMRVRIVLARLTIGESIWELVVP